jgi:thiosulfate dehydrogenase [quinone] large subunit
MAYRRATQKSIADSWRAQSWAIRVLRAWLSFTWIYAGWDKATDPGFLTKGATGFIGDQLIAFSTNSPVSWLFSNLSEQAIAVGLFVIFSEFAIGIATLLWIAPTSAAFGGFLTSIILWLASTFYVSPFFLASNTAYAILWLVYFLTLVGNRRTVDIALDRRGAIRISALSLGAVAAALVGKAFTKVSETSNTTVTGSSQIIELAKFNIGETHQFALSDGMPAILFRTKTGVFAYSATCTHQGCTVAYQSSNKSLYCPCHGAEFDPFKNGDVITGPTRDALPTVKVKISGDWVVLA